MHAHNTKQRRGTHADRCTYQQERYRDIVIEIYAHAQAGFARTFNEPHENQTCKRVNAVGKRFVENSSGWKVRRSNGNFKHVCFSVCPSVSGRRRLRSTQDSGVVERKGISCIFEQANASSSRAFPKFQCPSNFHTRRKFISVA